MPSTAVRLKYKNKVNEIFNDSAEFLDYLT